jgi:uncharacterized protein (DUF2267 family)
MSEQGLETIETTRQKTHEWIARIVESMRMEKRDAWKSLRSVLRTLRDRLPIDLGVHFEAQLPMLVRGLYYEGWEPSKVPIKMSREGFLAAVQSRIHSQSCHRSGGNYPKRTGSRRQSHRQR